MAKQFYLGIVSTQDAVRAKGFDSMTAYASHTHTDLWPYDTHDLSRHWRIAKNAIQFDEAPSMEVFFRTMDWAESEGVKLSTLQLGWHGRMQPLSQFDPRQLRERHMPKVPRKTLTLREVALPLAEIGPSRPTRMQIQKRYEAFRSIGYSIRRALAATELEFEISDLGVDSSGKTIVTWRNGVSEAAIQTPEDKLFSKFTGMPIHRCDKCHGLLAHRNGQPLPCQKCDLIEAADPERDWLNFNRGYEFTVYSGRSVMSNVPPPNVVGRSDSLPKARTMAKDHYRRTGQRTVVFDKQMRKYFTLG